MQRNKGFSMIELIVAIALLGIAVTLIGGSITQIFSLDQRQCANELNSAISRCKIGAMSRAGDVYLKLSVSGDGVFCTYYENDTQTEQRKIGKPTLTISYTDDAGVNHTVTEAAPLYLSFVRTTGAFLKVGDAQRLADPAAAPADYYCETIHVGAYRVELIPVTGRHDVAR
ncbi:MAG: hypothetical protein ABT01_06560 [Clostridium sp. SCN 57-10]|nr:MAG: hypothetical protein ABT01_06560 [Clostridium sp. SCN 57-10]